MVSHLNYCQSLLGTVLDNTHTTQCMRVKTRIQHNGSTLHNMVSHLTYCQCITRFVAVALLIDEFENLNRAECSLVAVPSKCVREECVQVRRQFEERLAAIVQHRQAQLNSIFRTTVPHRRGLQPLF